MELHKHDRGNAVKWMGRGLGSAFAAAGLLLLAATDASAATYRYSASSNRIYVEGGGTATLSAIKAAVPLAPVDLIDAPNKIWLLSANLIVADGTVLNMHGTAAGGDVNELRIQSNNVSGVGAFMSITADYGTLSFQGVKVTSWDSDAGAPDAEHATFGRAFIRVRSMLGPDGVTPLQSRMDIINSEIQNLGHDASESYGLVWKVTGTDPALTSKVDVLGDVINSHIHNMFQGVYTFGHKSGQLMDNHVHHNASYGLYVHDDSDTMVIDGNDVHDNGADGIYVTEKSDHATIRNNKSYANAGHGLRLRNGANAATVETNEFYQNTDTGVAIFNANGATVDGNLIHDNAAYGVRITQNGADNIISNNEINNNSRYGIYVYLDAGSVPPAGTDGRPKNNTLSTNDIHNNAQDGIRVLDTDGTIVLKNTFTGNIGTTLLFQNAVGSVFQGNKPQPGSTVKLIGTTERATTVKFVAATLIKLQIDAFSTADFTDPLGTIYDVPQNVSAFAFKRQAKLTLTTAKLGTTSTTVQRRKLTAKVAVTGQWTQINPTIWFLDGDRRKSWTAKSSDGAVQVAYTVGDLLPATSYQVTIDGAPFGTFTSDAAGKIAFSVTPGTTAQRGYMVLPAAP